MSLVVLLTSVSLLASPADIQNIISYHYQKPTIYAHASKVKDEGLERRLALYRDLIFKPNVGKNALKMALDFYNDVLKDSQNNDYLAEAYYNSGYILLMFDPKDVGGGIRRLDEAYKIGDKDRKIQVLHAKFVLARDYENMPEKYPSLRSPEYYVKKLEKIEPNGEITMKLKKELRRFRESQKPK